MLEGVGGNGVRGDAQGVLLQPSGMLDPSNDVEDHFRETFGFADTFRYAESNTSDTVAATPLEKLDPSDNMTDLSVTVANI